MNNIPFDNHDRTELAQFLNEEVSFEGQVVNTCAPSKDKHFVCLRNVKIARRDDDVAFKDRSYVICHHIWLETSDIDHMKTRITDTVYGSCTVVPYKRKDGTKSYCLRFKQKGLTEGALFDRFIEGLDIIALNSSELTLAAQQHLVNNLLSSTEETALSGRVYFHTESRPHFLKKLRSRRRACMRRAGITVPANRAGRRFIREGMKARHRRALPQAVGFC
jgi:hypothetical protein